MPGAAEAGDHFGASVAVFDMFGDGCTDLMIGAPDEDLGSVANAGAVWRVHGGQGGLDFEATQVLSQGAVGYPGVAEAGDRFGERVAVARHAIVVAVPREDLGSRADAGIVQVFDPTPTEPVVTYAL